MEFHISRKIRDEYNFDKELFATDGNVIFTNFTNVRKLTQLLNNNIDPVLHPERFLKAGQLNAMGLIDEIFHIVCSMYRKEKQQDAFKNALAHIEKIVGKDKVSTMLLDFTKEFPPKAVYQATITEEEYLAKSKKNISNKVSTLEEIILLHLANENPALKPFLFLFSDSNLAKNKTWEKTWKEIKLFFEKQPVFGPKNNPLITMLKEPVIASPNSLKGQLDYIRKYWGNFLGEWLKRLLSGIDMISEEDKPGWNGNFSGPPPMDPYKYDSLMNEYERYSPDKDWMPQVILMAKTVLVWLDQLTKKYGTEITRLDQIPDEELDHLAQAGFTGLWLIGLWERSYASKRIKQKCGNTEAAASAYSLYDYEIAANIGGWPALENLRTRLWFRGIRLASDMVPNHTGLDAKWIINKPQLFIQTSTCPFPTYNFNNENLSQDPRISIYLEDHYYSKDDCAVVFKRVDNRNGDTRYIYHGNDGTGMPWNDTAQIDFLNPEAREEVIQEILHVARNFPIIRFDAAMVLAKKHIRRLWYPEPGQGGDIASRSEYAISRDDFEKAIPQEFWREVVDRVAKEVPDTLLLAEAFWMMEGYFVRTLGMHRVYNSAFMNMLMKEENDKYRATIKNTIEFDPQILKRYVNFMNNPDEDTAVAQFGKGDKYFGVCTLMVTMPGLPMFGHGQLEGFTEKYGMEFTKAYKDEQEDYGLIEQHKRVIFPLMRKRYLFSGVDNFFLYDFWCDGYVNENVFSYSNCCGLEKALIFYNNKYDQTHGWIKQSCSYIVKDNDGNSHMESKSLGEALKLQNNSNNYCIFQEQKSSKWFIRNCAEIYEKGMFASLNGFEYQVLWNITEVSDDGTGMYSELCKSLEGKGVPDIDVALKEIFLKDLYKTLEDFANKDFFTHIAELCEPERFKTTQKDKKHKTKTLTASLKEIEAPALAYFAMFELFLQGNYGSSTIIDSSKTGTKATAEKTWSHFKNLIRRLVKLFENGRNNTGSAIEMRLYKWMKTIPNISEMVTSTIMLYSLRDTIGEKATAADTAKLVNLWCLNRKIRDILVSYGYPSKDMYETFKIVQAAALFCDEKLKEKNFKHSAYVLISSLLSDENAPLVMGVNNYDNTLWFNKEKSDFAFNTALLLYVIFTIKPAEYPKLEAFIKFLEDEREKSFFKAEVFLENLKEKPTSKKAGLKN
ncbi:MAG: hypothetical protein BKP49_07300 [Treponema sp. CETP13]|nr:MAG: hypothetical protein BKP49_07300 [Treponema sp. CETP13]